MATTRTLTIFINGKEVENNLKSIKAEYIKLYNEVAKMNVNQEGYNEKVKELKRVKGIVDEHRSTMSGVGKTWDKLKDGVAMATPYIAGAFAVFKTGEKIINSAQGASDKWEASLTGLRWGLDSVMKSIATWDFSNFFENIGKSIKAGKEYAQVLDDLGDRNRAYRVTESELRIEIEKQERIRDNVLLSNQERLDAALEIDRLERESLKENTDIKQTAFDNEVKRVTTFTNLTDEQVKQFVKLYNAQKPTREEAEAYQEVLDDLNGQINAINTNNAMMMAGAPAAARAYNTNTTEVDKLNKKIQELNESTPEAIRSYAMVLKSMGKTSDEELDKAVQAWTDLNGAELSYMQNTQKNERKINDLKKSFSDEEQKRAEEARKRAEALAKKLEEIQYRLNQYNKASVLIEIEDAHRKYRELENEAKGNSQAIIKIKELEQQEIAQIQDKNKRQLSDDINKVADEFEKLLDSDSKAFRDYVNNTSEISQQNKDLIKQMLDSFRQEIKSQEQRDIFGMTQDDWDNLKNNFDEIAKYATLALSTYAAYSDYLSAQEENELRRYERNNNEKKDQLENRLKAGVISEKVYNRSIANMDADLEAKRRAIANEQARREKNIRIFESIINTAAAVVEALPNIPLSIAVGIAGAAQTALIAATEIPEFADGGRIPKKTLLIAGEAGEEGILSNRTLTSPSTGPLANWLLDTQQGLNPRFPATAVPVSPQVSSFGTSSLMATTAQPQVVVQPADNSELLTEIRRMNEFLSDPKNRQAYIMKDIMTKDSEEENFRTSIQKLK